MNLEVITCEPERSTHTSMGGMVIQKYLESHQAPAAVLLGSGPPSGVIPATLRTFRRHPMAVG